MTARRRDATRVLLLAAMLVVFLAPLAWTALASIGLLPDNSTRPPSWTGPATLEHFSEIGIAEPTFWQELATSTIAAACAATLAVAVSFFAAYGLARSSFRANRGVTQGFLVLASLPAMAYVIPLSDVLRRVHLLDTLAGVVLSEAAVTAPLAVFVLYGAIAQLSVQWEEAAVLDGAGLLQVVGRVILPLLTSVVVRTFAWIVILGREGVINQAVLWLGLAPAPLRLLQTVAATAVVLFVLDWNMLLVPLVLTSGEIKTIPVAMSDFFTFERELDWPTAAAALIVSLGPVAVLVGLFHGVLDRFSLGAGTGA